MLQRNRGWSRSAGGSQAKARTWTTSSGGKGPRATGTGEFLKASQAALEEALAPQADDFAAGVEAAGDGVIAEVLGGEQDHPGASDLKVRQRIASGAPMQFSTL